MILHFIKNEELPFPQFSVWVSSLHAALVQIRVLPIVLTPYHPSGSIFSSVVRYRFGKRSHDDYSHPAQRRIFDRESPANLDSARPDRIVSGLLTTGFTACFFLSKARIPLCRRKRDGALAYNFRMRF